MDLIRPLQVERYADAAAFLKAAGPWLAADEVANNVMLTVARSVADGSHVLKEAPYFATVREGGMIACCGSMTPPHPLLLAQGVSRAAAVLAADAYDAVGRVPGVVGPRTMAAAFVAAWVGFAGGSARISMRQRLHRIEQVNADLPVVPGTLRKVEGHERDLAIQWCVAFAHEAIPDRPSDDAAIVDAHLRTGTLYVWDDGRPVTICATPAGTERVRRINFVYTPPELRRRGYATAAVAALTRQLLASGCRCCCLYTDLANPTSNSVYHRIGYRPVFDVDQYAFTAT